MSYRASAEVMQAVSRALTRLQPHWPRNLQLATDPSAAGLAFLSGYCQACIGADLDAIPEAAAQWLTSEKFAPKPVELGKLARDITYARPGRSDSPRTEREESAPPRPEHADDVDRLSRQAYAVLRGWSQVAMCWSVAWEDAANEMEREQVQFGRLPIEVWNIVIGQVANGRVSCTVGPLARPLAREMQRGAP